MKHQHLLAPIIIAGVFLTQSLLGHAQPPPVYQETLAIGGTELITLRGETQQAVRTRADTVYARLVWILADASLNRQDIWVKMTIAEPAIYVKTRLLVTVMAQDAAYNQTTPENQAQIWRKRFMETLPFLKVANPPSKP